MLDELCLPFSTRTSSGERRQFQLRLHRHTRSVAHVGMLVETMLASVSEIVEREADVSDGDVLQALTLAAAVRLDVAGVPTDTAKTLMQELISLALETTSDARPDETAPH